MPSCLRAHEAAPWKNHELEWREPPGYLGEAVRRAKKIRVPPPPEPPRPLEGLPPPA